MKPEQDPELRKAIKGNRVMTVFQKPAGKQADHGSIGFEPGTNRQFLIFPKSLRSFEGKEIVGIKYDLLKVKEIPKSQRAAPPKPAQPRKQKSKKVREAEASAEPVTEESPRTKQDQHVEAIKKKVRRAMKILEEGKAVAAFNLLKKITEE